MENTIWVLVFPNFCELPNENIQFHGTLERNLKQHGILSRHTVALQHIRNALRVSIKLWLILRCYIQIDKGNDMITKLHWVNLRVVPGNDAVFLQLLNAG